MNMEILELMKYDSQMNIIARCEIDYKWKQMYSDLKQVVEDLKRYPGVQEALEYLKDK